MTRNAFTLALVLLLLVGVLPAGLAEASVQLINYGAELEASSAETGDFSLRSQASQSQARRGKRKIFPKLFSGIPSSIQTQRKFTGGRSPYLSSGRLPVQDLHKLHAVLRI